MDMTPSDLNVINGSNKTDPYSVRRYPQNMSKSRQGSYRLGELYPIFVAEALPGDNWKLQLFHQLRMEALKTAIFNTVDIEYTAFFQSYRTLWKKFRNFYTTGRKGNYQPPLPVIPLHTKSNTKHSLFDYLGLPILTATNDTLVKDKAQGYIFTKNTCVNPFAFLMYDSIKYWFFTNQHIEENIVYNIQDELTLDNKDFFNIQYLTNDFYAKSSSGQEFYTRLHKFNFDETFDYSDSSESDDSFYYAMVLDENLGKLHVLNWEDDYFTSAHTQQLLGGDPVIPLDVTLNDTNPDGSVLSAVGVTIDKGTRTKNAEFALQTGTTNVTINTGGSPDKPFITAINSNEEGNYTKQYLNNIQLASAGFSYTDFSFLSAVAEGRQALLLGGYEYGDHMRYVWGRRIDDDVLQKPQFIGAHRSVFMTDAVYQTAPSSDSVVGDYAGRGTSTDRSYEFDYTPNEAGIVMVLLSFRVKPIYRNQGIPRFWLKDSLYDFYKPNLQNLPEQEIQNRELFVDISMVDMDSSQISQLKNPFGYTGAWNDLRYSYNDVVADFRDILDYSIISRGFSAPPALNPSFLQMQPEQLTGIFAVTDTDKVYPIQGTTYVKATVYRDLPYTADMQIHPTVRY